MRIHSVLLTVLLTGAPVVAAAQTPPAPAAPAAAAPDAAATTTPPFTGSVDFGVRGTSLDGDGARYERYRDLGDGGFLDALRTTVERGNWFVDGAIDHLGRRDQRYDVNLTRPGRAKIWARYDQIPMLMSRTTQTLYAVESPNTFRIDDTIQQTLQGTATAQQAAVMTNFVNTLARTFDTESRRHITSAGVQLMPDALTTVGLSVQRTNRDGVIPFGGTFGFSNAIELPAPVSHHTTDVDATAEREQGPWLFRAGYSASLFHNDFTSMVWDNPYRLQDSATVPSQGRLALAPSNSSMTVNGSASVKLPYRSRVTGYVSFGVLDDRGAAVLPQTINTALPAVPIERTTVDGHAQTRAVNLTFTSRPTAVVGVNVRLRHYTYDNQTPIFENVASRVAYDTSVQTLATPSETERYGASRLWFDADVTAHVAGSTVGAGYSRQDAEYEERIFASSAENTARLFYDAYSSRWFSVHSKYEHAVRTGKGLDTTGIAAAGEQPGMRTFDIADRNRHLFTLTGVATPVSSLAISVSAGTGRDKYPHSQFGLFNAKHHIYSVGADLTAGEHVTAGVSYDAEDYRTLQWSRQANPGVQFTDPSRDWSTDGHDRVHSFLATAQLVNLAEKVDVRFNYDFNRGRTLYLYGTGSVLDRTLPEGSTGVPTTLPAPVQLPEVFSELQRSTVDTTYALTSRYALGFSYWYERYRVDDFALDAEGIPRINLPNALLLGYQYLPYDAHTFWGRFIVRW